MFILVLKKYRSYLTLQLPLHTNQLVYVAVNQHANGLGAYEQNEPSCSVISFHVVMSEFGCFPFLSLNGGGGSKDFTK